MGQGCGSRPATGTKCAGRRFSPSCCCSVIFAASPSRQFEPKGPFSFAGPWAMGADAAMGERTTSGAFSPSILRLTEDIGNLLQEDDPDDDAYALGIPSVFRGARAASGNNDTAEAPSDATDFDWTGSFVCDTERTTKRAAMPSWTSEGAEKAGSQRAEGREQHKQRQQETTSRFVPCTQQPKPRRNEVFEFGRQQHQQQSSSRAMPSDERASPQLLSFGANALDCAKKCCCPRRHCSGTKCCATNYCCSPCPRCAAPVRFLNQVKAWASKETCGSSNQDAFSC